MDPYESTATDTPRACGDEREDGGLYLCLPLSRQEGGLPVEEFLIDPVLPWTEDLFRGPRMHQRSDGGYDIVLCVGEEYYPWVPDYIEEVRRLGLSKRIPINKSIDYSLLVPYVSRIVLIHPKAYHHGSYVLDRKPEVPPRLNAHPNCDHSPYGDMACVYNLWSLSYPVSSPKHLVSDSNRSGEAVVRVPFGSYRIGIPSSLSTVQFSPGIFAAFPLGHFEYVNKDAASHAVPSLLLQQLGVNANHLLVTRQ